MAKKGDLTNSIRLRREQAGLSQGALASAIGISRQAMVGIESGKQVPSTSSALRLATLLGCAVEQLFTLAAQSEVSAILAPSNSSIRIPSNRVVLGKVDDAWIAHRLFAEQRVAADGIVIDEGLSMSPRISVRPLTKLKALEEHLLVAGCAPALTVACQRLSRQFPGTRATWISANSSEALRMLETGVVHLAGLHLANERSKNDHFEILRRRFPNRRLTVVNFAKWRQGYVVASGNPKGIHHAGDLCKKNVRVALREKGAGATKLLTRELQRYGGTMSEIERNDPLVAPGHLEVARMVKYGAADVGIAIENMAYAYGLDFIPLAQERFDIVVPAERCGLESIAKFIDCLSSAALKDEIGALGGYDMSMTGKMTTVGEHGEGGE